MAGGFSFQDLFQCLEGHSLRKRLREFFGHFFRKLYPERQKMVCRETPDFEPLGFFQCMHKDAGQKKYYITAERTVAIQP